MRINSLVCFIKSEQRDRLNRLFFLFTVFWAGLSGIVVQVLLAREFLVSICSIELIVGFILANWVLVGAAGSVLFGWLVEQWKAKFVLYFFLHALFFLGLPGVLYLTRVAKPLVGVPPAQNVGFIWSFTASFLILLLVRLFHGGLFSCACRVFNFYFRDSKSGSIGRVYVWETVGAIAGGFAVTYLFLPYFGPFQILIFLALFDFSLLLVQTTYLQFPNWLTTGLTVVTLLLLVFLLFGGGAWLQDFSLARRWRGYELVYYKNSPYKNIMITSRADQYTLLFNGLPVTSLPGPDQVRAEEFGHLPLLFHPRPERVALLGCGPGGLINELLKQPVKRIDYLELDPLVLTAYRKLPGELPEKELGADRVNVITRDSRQYIQSTKRKYEVILVGLAAPANLESNRFFTWRFFRSVRRRLTPRGIFAFRLPASLSRLSPELLALNRTVINSLQSVFAEVRVIPGSENLVLASPAEWLQQLTISQLQRRLKKRQLQTSVLTSRYLADRLTSVAPGASLLETKNGQMNRDFKPIAVFKFFQHLDRLFGARLGELFRRLSLFTFQHFIWGCLTFLLIFLILLAFIIFLPGWSRRPVFSFSLLSSGFICMMVTLVLSFAFQVFYGSLYYELGLLLTASMAGLAAGALTVTGFLPGEQENFGYYLLLELALVFFVLFFPRVINFLNNYASTFYLAEPRPWLYLLFLLGGFLVGAQFPLANQLILTGGGTVGSTSGLLYGADLLGGWFAGILVPVILLPLLGLAQTFTLLAIIKAGSLILVFTVWRF